MFLSLQHFVFARFWSKLWQLIFRRDIYDVDAGLDDDCDMWVDYVFILYIRSRFQTAYHIKNYQNKYSSVASWDFPRRYKCSSGSLSFHQNSFRGITFRGQLFEDTLFVDTAMFRGQMLLRRFIDNIFFSDQIWRSLKASAWFTEACNIKFWRVKVTDGVWRWLTFVLVQLKLVSMLHSAFFVAWSQSCKPSTAIPCLRFRLILVLCAIFMCNLFHIIFSGAAY